VAGERLQSDADVDALVEIYVRARARVQSLLEAAAARGAKGTEAYYRQQRAAIDAALARVEQLEPEAIARAIRASYLDGATLVDGTLKAPEPLTVDVFGRFSGAHENAVLAMAGRVDARFAAARATIGRKAPDALARIARLNVAEGIAAGLTRRDVSKSIERDLVAEGITSFVDKSGRRWPIDVYAEMAARTTTREAVTVGTTNRLLELGRDLVEISKHFGSCAICLPFEGRIFSLTGQTPGYPVAEVLPPYHPFCRHVATPAPIFDENGDELPGAIAPQPPQVPTAAPATLPPRSIGV
jgi:hypothetical protein